MQGEERERVQGWGRRGGGGGGGGGGCRVKISTNADDHPMALKIVTAISRVL